MNKRSMILVSTLSVIMLLTLTVGLTLAQGSAPGSEPAQPGAPADTVGNYIPVQGRLTDASGNPLNATLTITFRLYDMPGGGTELCHDTNTVAVSNGLFNSQIYGNCAGQMTGQQLYLALQIGSDAEMTPRQPIYAVPYAWSLKPGAVISGATGVDPIVHIETWSTSGRGLRAYAMAETGTNYGMVGASRSPDGYGGYFYDTAGGVGLKAESDGVALQLTGSGRIESTADMTVAVSPLKMIPQWESSGDLEFLSDGAYMEIRPVTSGFQYVHIPVDIPSTLFGTTTRLKSVRICYRVDQAGSFVSTTILSQGTDSGTFSQSINDTTDRNSTGWECYTVTDATPDVIQGSVYVQLTLSFAGTGAMHDIRIGNIALGLTEQ
jgi:hypothetical protein